MKTLVQGTQASGNSAPDLHLQHTGPACFLGRCSENCRLCFLAHENEIIYSQHKVIHIYDMTFAVDFGVVLNADNNQ